jgi:hypothetical protein
LQQRKQVTKGYKYLCHERTNYKSRKELGKTSSYLHICVARKKVLKEKDSPSISRLAKTPKQQNDSATIVNYFVSLL